MHDHNRQKRVDSTACLISHAKRDSKAAAFVSSPSDFFDKHFSSHATSTRDQTDKHARGSKMRDKAANIGALRNSCQEQESTLMTITRKYPGNTKRLKKGKDKRFYSPSNRYYAPLDEIKDQYLWKKLLRT